MSDAMSTEFSPHPKAEIPTVNILPTADVVVSDSVNKLSKDKVRLVKSKVSKWRMALAVPAASFIAACGWGDQQNFPPIPEPTPISRTFVPTQTLTPNSDSAKVAPPIATQTLTETPRPPEFTYMEWYRGMKIAIDNEGLPIHYILPDGKRVELNKEEVKKIREKAISSKEPEIITMIPIKESSGSEYVPSPERPRTLELPKDVLSEEELEKRGVKTIQADNTNLFIREGAFGKDALLEDFNNTDRKLTIVLVNGTRINPLYMQDPRYEEFRKFFTRLDGSTADPVKMANDQMEKLAVNLKQDIEKFKNERDVSSFSGRILNLKQNIFVLEEKMVREQFLDYVGSELYLEGKVKGFYKRGENAFIFLAVGGIEYNKRFATIYFDQEGSVAVDTNWEFSTYYSEGGFDPKAIETHPSPEDIPKVIASSDYERTGLYHHLTAGFSFRHESAHDLLIQQEINKGKRPNWSEHDTDVKAMEGISEAWKKWEASGFTDNSGYYFVFSLPPEEGGGYILTDSKKPYTKTPHGT